MFQNIFREMAAHNRMNINDLSKELGICSKSLSNKLERRTAFRLDEMLKIQQIFGGKITLDELFKWVE